jgi:hypothetical protein
VSRDRDRDVVAAADATLGAALDGLDAVEASQLLSALANRAAVRLHGLTRGEATARKGQADWAAWAALQNAARTLVLQSSTCRDMAGRLGGPSAST